MESNRVSSNNFYSGGSNMSIPARIFGELNYTSVNKPAEGIDTAVVVYPSYEEFPSLGDSRLIYIDESRNNSYRFDDKTCTYYCIGSNYEDIKTIEGGCA